MKHYLTVLIVSLSIVTQAFAVDQEPNDIISGDKKFSAFISNRKVDSDSLINSSLKKLGFEEIEYFRDGLNENNAYLFSKTNNQFLILNIRHHVEKEFYFFSISHIKTFFSHETTEFLPEWDADSIHLASLREKIQKNSYEGIIRLEVMLDSLDKKSSWRITSSNLEEYDETLNLIKTLEKPFL